MLSERCFRAMRFAGEEGCSHSLVGVGDTLFLWDPSSCRLGDGWSWGSGWPESKVGGV